jgi:hypothetical protein
MTRCRGFMPWGGRHSLDNGAYASVFSEILRMDLHSNGLRISLPLTARKFMVTADRTMKIAGAVMLLVASLLTAGV